MLNDFFSQIVVSVIAGLILIGITYLFRRNIKLFVIGVINKLTTGGRIGFKLKYKSAQKFIERKLKNAKKLKVMVFMGKDLVVEPGFLEDIRRFLDNGGKAIFLIEDPNSKYVIRRAKKLNIFLNALKIIYKIQLFKFNQSLNAAILTR